MEEDGQCYQEMKLNEPPKCPKCGDDLYFDDYNMVLVCECGFIQEE